MVLYARKSSFKTWWNNSSLGIQQSGFRREFSMTASLRFMRIHLVLIGILKGNTLQMVMKRSHFHLKKLIVHLLVFIYNWTQEHFTGYISTWSALKHYIGKNKPISCLGSLKKFKKVVDQTMKPIYFSMSFEDWKNAVTGYHFYLNFSIRFRISMIEQFIFQFIQVLIIE